LSSSPTQFSCFFFLLPRPRPPRSPLFPYTTLFRSHGARRVLGRAVGMYHQPRWVRLIMSDEQTDECMIFGPAEVDESEPLPSRLDRKSTRLNSSHLGISYAVFCLKKKKKSQSMLDT